MLDTDHGSRRWLEIAGRCLCLGDSVPRGTTQQHNTHIRDLREICYSWHPWHGRPVWVLATLVKRGQALARCSLEGVPACRVLEVPLWMLDVGPCGKTRLSSVGIVSTQGLRELNRILHSVLHRAHSHFTLETEDRYLPKTGGADGSIGGPAEIEPTDVVRSSAIEFALDKSVVRCSTKDSPITGAVTEVPSKDGGSGETRTGGGR